MRGQAVGSGPRRADWRSGRDSVGAPLISAEHVLLSDDDDIAAQALLKHPKLTAAQVITRNRSGTDGAMVLDEQQIVAVDHDLGHVPLGRPLIGEASHSLVRRAFSDDAAVLGALASCPLGDHQGERLIAERGPNRVDQIQREVSVAIGKRAVRPIGELPSRGGTPAPVGAAPSPADQPGLVHRLQVLANCGVGEIELSGELAGGRRIHALETLHETSLRVRKFEHDFSLAISEVPALVKNPRNSA